MKYEFRFCVSPVLPALEQRLVELKIKYTLLHNIKTHLPYEIVFDLLEDSPYLQEIMQLIPKMDTNSTYRTSGKLNEIWHCGEFIPELGVFSCYSLGDSYVTIMTSLEYSKEDMEKARWFRLHSEHLRLDISNWNEFELVEKCMDGKKLNHFTLEKAVAIKRVPKWKPKTCFATACEFYCSSILFCNDRAKTLIESNNLKGAEFRPVLKKDERSIHLDINQIYATQTIPNEAILANQYMEFYNCPICGCQKVKPLSNRAFFWLDTEKFDDSIDFYKTQTFFRGSQILIVSHRVYKLIIQNQINRGLIFVPLLPFEGR